MLLTVPAKHLTFTAHIFNCLYIFPCDKKAGSKPEQVEPNSLDLNLDCAFAGFDLIVTGYS